MFCLFYCYFCLNKFGSRSCNLWWFKNRPLQHAIHILYCIYVPTACVRNIRGRKWIQIRWAVWPRNFIQTLLHKICITKYNPNVFFFSKTQPGSGMRLLRGFGLIYAMFAATKLGRPGFQPGTDFDFVWKSFFLNEYNLPSGVKDENILSCIIYIILPISIVFFFFKLQ